MCNRDQASWKNGVALWLCGPVSFRGVTFTEFVILAGASRMLDAELMASLITTLAEDQREGVRDGKATEGH